MVRAVVVATAATESGGGAAGLMRVGPTTLLGRLRKQLKDHGVHDVTVLTRPEWRQQCQAALAGDGVEVIGVGTLAAAFQEFARLAARDEGPLLLLQGELLMHGSVLAGLLHDPRVPTGIASSAGVRSAGVFGVRIDRGRVTSAESPYHEITRPTAAFLGMLKVATSDLAALAGAAADLAFLCREGLPARWEPELATKVTSWGQLFFRHHAGIFGLIEQVRREAGNEKWLPDVGAMQADLDAKFRAAVLHPAATAAEDAVSILLTAVVRSGVVLTSSYLRELFWARPLDQRNVDAALTEMAGMDEDRVLLDSAVKASDGFFTTFFVSPYSRYLARWAARRRLTPNHVTVTSMVLGAMAAAAFAQGSSPGLIAGALLLQVSFTTDCVDGQLARYTRQFSKLGAWLDSIFDRAKEYLVYAGLATGAVRQGAGQGIWLLAGAALALQTFRHVIDFSYAAQQHRTIATVPKAPLDWPEDRLSVSLPQQDLTATVDDGPEEAHPQQEATPADPPGQPVTNRGKTMGRLAIEASVFFERRPWLKWGKRILILPIGERFALISITAALWGARTAFLALLVWGTVAAAYTTMGRVLRSIA